jgi:hypothetical protein
VTDRYVVVLQNPAGEVVGVLGAWVRGTADSVATELRHRDEARRGQLRVSVIECVPMRKLGQPLRVRSWAVPS